MKRKSAIVAALLFAAPVWAGGPPTGSEVSIPHMATFLEWIPDGVRGFYVRADDARWYYARFASDCARIANRSNIRFEPALNGDFDRYSAVYANGWRCQVDSVVASDGPPRRHRRS